MGEQLLLAVDIGSTTTKGALYRLDGSVKCSASRKHTVSSPKEGYAEHDAEAIWWAEVSAVCRELTANEGVDAGDIAAVGVSALSPALVPVDRTGHALCPAMLYGMDRRARKEIAELRELMKGRDGEVVSPLSIGPKILWLKRHEPEIFEKAVYFVGAPSFIVYRLTGQMVADHACYMIGGCPFSKVDLRWDEEMCRACGITPERLPELRYGSEVGGYVTPGAAAETGLAAGTPVSVGTGDFPAECCSYGTIYESTFRFSFGTTVGVNFGYNSSGPLFKGYDHTKKAPGWLKGGGAMDNGCSTIDWVLRLISAADPKRAVSDEVLTQFVESAPPGSNGVIMLPYLNGGNKPIDDPQAKGMIFGLQLSHTAADIYRAALEALAYSIRYILQNAPDHVHDALVLGGGTNIPGLMQIVSDVTGFDLIMLKTTNGSLLGAAFLAGMACGIFTSLSDIDPWIETGGVIRPDRGNKAVYDKGFEKYVALYEATAELMHL